MRSTSVLLSGVFLVGGPAAAWAGGPAWAAEVVSYDPAFQQGLLPARQHMDAKKALGSPRRYKDVSLGRGGLLELGFGTRVLTNSGDATPDLRVVEVGPDVERMFVALMPADEATARAVDAHCQDVRAPFRDGFCEIGTIDGGQRSLDIDAAFPGHAKGTLRFSAVQLVDDPDQGELAGRSVGADISAVGAYFHLPSRVEENHFFVPAPAARGAGAVDIKAAPVGPVAAPHALPAVQRAAEPAPLR